MRYFLFSFLLLVSTAFCQAQAGPFEALGSSVLSGQDRPTFLPVEQAYQVNVSHSPSGIRLQWRITDGYFLYRHGFKAAVNGQDVSSSAKLTAGIAKTDDLFGEVEIYYREMVVDLPLDTEPPLLLELQSQGCSDEGLCYPPYKQRFELSSIDGSFHALDPDSVAATPPAAGAGLPRDLSGNSLTLPMAALFAFFGGLILNLMPCVLPVLSLKALGLASSHSNRSQRIAHGWWYTGGIVLSFCAIAGLLIGLKSAGSAIGWGFQLQSSWFVGALVYLFFLMAFLLAGAADFSGQWMGFGQALASGGGYRGSFFTGALAVLVASPCTAPFMGTAMGFALTQGSIIALLVFICLGLGMAAPFLLLSYLPQLGRWLPKPGAWMERFREFLAFPLLATAIWLLWVVGRQNGVDAVAVVLCGCLLIAVALWFNGASPAVKITRLVLFSCALLLLANPMLRAANTDDRGFEGFSETRVEQLRAQGVPVFVNFTADWCITCLANETLVLSTDAVTQAFKQQQIAYLKADWTNYDPVISATLESWDRSGIPLYLYYPADPDSPAQVLPQILSVELVLSVIAANEPGAVP